MKKKIVYEAPETELVEVKEERGFLTSVGSVESMTTVGGSWDDEDE